MLSAPVSPAAMQLQLRDSAYADRLAAFLRSLGQAATVSGGNRVELGADTAITREELRIYLRVWRVLYPDADVAVVD